MTMEMTKVWHIWTVQII